MRGVKIRISLSLLHGEEGGRAARVPVINAFLDWEEARRGTTNPTRVLDCER